MFNVTYARDLFYVEFWRLIKLKLSNGIPIETVIEFINQAPDEELAGLTVARLAKVFNTDRFHLLRAFKKQVNVTPEVYLFRVKMMRSAWYLEDRNTITIAEIAIKMGYCTCAYFVQKFKKFHGVHPEKYREYRRLRSGIKDRRAIIANLKKQKSTAVTALSEKQPKTVTPAADEKDQRTDGTPKKLKGSTPASGSC